MNKTSVFARGIVRGITRVFLLALGVVVTLAACSSEQNIGSTSSSGVISANPSTRGGGTQERTGGGLTGVADTDESILGAFVGFTREADGGSRVNTAPGDLDIAEAVDSSGTSMTPGALVATPLQKEYISQGALHQVGSAYAYARSTGTVRRQAGGLTGFAVVAGQPNLGEDSHINIISGLAAGSFVLEDSLDLEYPEFSQRAHRVRLLVTVGGDTRTVDVVCADVDDCQVDEVNAATDLTVTATTEYAPIGRVYGSGSNLQFIDERTIGTDTDNGLGEGVIALINGLRNRAGTQGIAPDATVSVYAADNSVDGEVLATLKASQSAGNAARGNVIIMDRTLALDATHGDFDFVSVALGQAFHNSLGDYVNTDINKLSAYVTRQGRGRFTVPTDGSLGDFSSYTVFLIGDDEYVRGLTVRRNAGTYTAGTAGRYRLPAGTVVDGRTLIEAEEIFFNVRDTFTLPDGGGSVTLPSVFLDREGNPLYDQMALNREMASQIIGGYYGATSDFNIDNVLGDNDIMGAMLDNMLAHNARNQDIYIFEAGITGALNEQSAFAGLPIIMEALAQDRRQAVQGIIDRAVAASDGVAYDAGTGTDTGTDTGTLTFNDGRQSFVIEGLGADTIDTTSVTSAELVSSDRSYRNVMVRLTFEDGTTQSVAVDADAARPMQSVLPYSLLVTDADYAASSTSSQCGAIAQDYCIAAPHTYTYHDTSTVAPADPETEGTSSHAPAALVAGGVALMQQIFEGQLTSAQIVDRLLRTASQNFDLDDTDGNDYVNNKANPDGDDLAEGAKRFGQGLLDLECAVRPVFATGEDARCRQNMVARAQADCLSQGWGWDDDTAQCVTATAADTCMDEDNNLQYIVNVGCRPTAMLCESLGQVYNPAATDCVATGADCPTGQGVMVDDDANRVCHVLEIDAANDVTQNEGAQACHLAGRAYREVRAEGTIASVACVAFNQCARGVDTSQVSVMGADVDGRSCVRGEDPATVDTCMNAGLGLSGGNCVTRRVCTASQSYVAADNTCAETPPTAASECAQQDKILNLGMGGDDTDNRCVDSVTDCGDMQTVNAAGDTCVAADGACVAPMGYDAITKECVPTPTRVAQCTSLGRFLGASASTTANVDGCVANATDCATDFAGQDGQCVAKIECVRLGQGYDGTTKTCVSASLMADDCYEASTDSVLNMAGDKCLTSRFDCAASEAATGDTTAGFACVAKADCLNTNMGYDKADRQCVDATTEAHCIDAVSTALLDTGTTGGCVASANACSSGRVKGMVAGMDLNTCITIDDCRTGVNNGNSFGAVVGDSKVCDTANAGNCSGFGGRSFAVATGCSASTETTAGVCEMNDGFELTTGVGCTAVCPNATDGYNTATSMCVTTPTTVAHCGVRRKVYKPTSLANPGGGGTCVGSSTTDASVCDTGTALIGGRCNLAIRCISSANSRQGYNATMKTCVAPTAVSCNAARTSYVFNAMVGSGSAACFETAVGCDNDEAAIANTDSQLVCQPKAECLNVSGMTGYAGDTTNVCTTASAMTCFNVSGTAVFNGGTSACVATPTGCNDDFAAVRDDSGMTATCTAKATACTGGVGYLAGQKVCGVPTRQSDCAGLTATYYDMRSGDDLCVASPTDCEADEAGITITGGNVCRGKEAACVGTVIGYDATNKICRVPQAASDCTSRDTLMIYNPRSGDHDVCVAAATNCDADEAVVSSTCTAKATACTGGAGYNGTTKACVPSGSVTGLAQCAGLTNMIYNEGDTANMGSCVLAAMNCDSGEAVSSGRCVEAASACTGMQGFNDTTRMCVAAGSVNNANHCRAAGKVLLSASDNCAATCADNEAPGPDGRGRCRAATTACVGGQGYNSTTKVCISVGSVENENQCIGSTPFFNATERGDPTQGNCVANVGACDDNEKAGGTPTTMMTCVTDRVSVCSSMNQVLVTAKDKCRAPKNAKECLGNTKVTSTNPVFVPAALAGTNNECVAAATNCPMGSVAVAGSDGRTTSCVAATIACGTRNAAVGGYCASAQLDCPAGEGYDPVTRMCSSVTGTDAEKLALCRNAGRHLNAAADGCIVRVALCGAGNVLASDGVDVSHGGCLSHEQWCCAGRALCHG